jgi:hypothetical protein
MHKAKLVEYNRGEEIMHLSPRGVEEAEKILRG